MVILHMFSCKLYDVLTNDFPMKLCLFPVDTFLQIMKIGDVRCVEIHYMEGSTGRGIIYMYMYGIPYTMLYHLSLYKLHK